MEITSSVDIRGALNALKIAQASPAKRERALKKAGLLQVTAIKERTADGVGVDGEFKDYSPSYAKRLRERRYGKKKPKGGFKPVRPVNLFYTGKMLADLGVVKATPSYALLSFRRPMERKKAQGNQRTRPFMGITPDEQRDIMRVFKRELFK
jgi:hypothetical protein